jgi:hypothetical protein
MARPPADSPEARWGLDAAATRILRACTAQAVLVESLLAGADDARQRDLVHAIELLLLFGLAELDVPVARAPAEAVADPGRPRPLDHLFVNRSGPAGAVTLYRCVGATCQPPLRDAAALAAVLG